MCTEQFKKEPVALQEAGFVACEGHPLWLRLEAGVPCPGGGGFPAVHGVRPTSRRGCGQCVDVSHLPVAQRGLLARAGASG